MINRKWRICLAGMFAMLFLGGCSLAVPDTGAEEKGDRLVGVFITPGYLDLYDMEGYLKTHGNLLAKGGEVTLPHDPEYEGRLYAQIDKTKGGEEWEISFGDVRGEYMLYLQQADEDEGIYRVCVCSDGISLSGERHVSRTVTGYNPDENTSIETFYALDQGIAAKAETEVGWNR